MYTKRLYELLGVEIHSEFLAEWCARSSTFAGHMARGFIGYPGELFRERMRYCLVGLAKDDIGVYDIRVKVALANVGPDVEYINVDSAEESIPPWKVVGAGEGVRKAVESYLLSEVDAKKASEQIVQTLHSTPWRR